MPLFKIGLMFCLLLLAGGARAGTVLVLGDSLSAAYGLQERQGWVSLLQTQVKTAGRNVSVINASISGETSAGGLARIAPLLERHQPSVVIVALGANDGLRGLPIQQVRKNLDSILQQSKSSGAKLLLLGIELPINYGRRYRQGFREMYAELAATHRAAFVPFFLVDIATDRSNFQADGIHPTAAAQPKLLARIQPTLDPLLSP